MIWRFGWSGEGAKPVLFAMLLVTEVYGLWALGTPAWYSWSRLPAVRPPTTPWRKVDVYVCTYDEPASLGERPAVLLELEDAAGVWHEVAAQIEVRSCREADGRYLVGATVGQIDPARMLLMDWCYVVCSHERLRGRRPAAPVTPKPIVLSLDAAPAPQLAVIGNP